MWTKSCDVTIQLKATEQFFHNILFVFNYLKYRNFQALLKFDFSLFKSENVSEPIMRKLYEWATYSTRIPHWRVF